MKTDFLVVACLLVAFVLAIMPIPAWAMWARPEWPLLVLLYWILAWPERYGIIVAAFVGFCQDNLTGSLIGQHMLAYAVVAAVFWSGSRRIRMFNVWHQAMLVGVLLLLSQLLQYWLVILTRTVEPAIGMLLLPALTGALLWPWFMIFLRGLRRRLGNTNSFGSM